MNNKKPKKPLNKFIRLTGIGLQMGITIYLASYLGKWLDLRYPNEKNIYNIILTLSGVVLSFYSLFVQIKKLDN
ncbi:MAG: AtpZ/AtpI family protein [Flavobacteriaceae bacterium]|nr:AtpZ/AtpI family protein [Flavobacteriaceae bacterium]